MSNMLRIVFISLLTIAFIGCGGSDHKGKSDNGSSIDGGNGNGGNTDGNGGNTDGNGGNTDGNGGNTDGNGSATAITKLAINKKEDIYGYKIIFPNMSPNATNGSIEHYTVTFKCDGTFHDISKIIIGSHQEVEEHNGGDVALTKDAANKTHLSWGDSNAGGSLPLINNNQIVVGTTTFAGLTNGNGHIKSIEKVQTCQ